jgi:hypothetical protein
MAREQPVKLQSGWGRDHSVLMTDGPTLGAPQILPLQLRELQKQLDTAREERDAAEANASDSSADRDRLRSEYNAVSQQLLLLDADLHASQVQCMYSHV